MTRIRNYKEMYKYGQLEMCFFYKYLLNLFCAYVGYYGLRGGQFYLYVMELTIGSFWRVRTKYSLKSAWFRIEHYMAMLQLMKLAIRVRVWEYTNLKSAKILDIFQQTVALLVYSHKCAVRTTLIYES
jgi:hypothetical protein